jgi:hypothetical protein
MSTDCCTHCHEPDRQRDAAYRRVLWLVLAVNAGMFAIEIGAGLAAGSASLQADALDFLGDAANYGISLFVVGLALRYRAMAALGKGATMMAFGIWVLGVAGWHTYQGSLPQVPHDGRGRICRADRQRRCRGHTVPVPHWRRQYALGLDMLAQ